MARDGNLQAVTNIKVQMAQRRCYRNPEKMLLITVKRHQNKSGIEAETQLVDHTDLGDRVVMLTGRWSVEDE